MGILGQYSSAKKQVLANIANLFKFISWSEKKKRKTWPWITWSISCLEIPVPAMSFYATTSHEIFHHSESQVGAVPECWQWAPGRWCMLTNSPESPQRHFFSQKLLQWRSMLKDWIILQLQFSATCELPDSVILRAFHVLKQLYKVQCKKLNSHFISITLYCKSSMDLAVNHAEIPKGCS